MGPIWQALAREAGIAAEQLAVGVTALGKANYAHNGLYHKAFFDLSIGFERSAKLAFILDFCIDNEGNFPSNKELRKFCHNLEELLNKTDMISEKLKLKNNQRLPNTDIHRGIIKTLSDFATKTRYYNLNFLTGDVKVEQQIDPLKAWYKNVIEPILAKHYSESQIKKHINEAHLDEEKRGDSTYAIFHTETGEILDSVFKTSLHSTKTEYAKKYSRMYVMQIIRFFAVLLSGLDYKAMEKRREDIPDMGEFFRIFNNPDSYFRSRKTWSIYKL